MSGDSFQKIKQFLDKQKFPNLQVLISNHKLDDDYIYSTTTNSQQFHSASVGKMMTAILIMKQVEKGVISLDTKINTILDKSVLDKLYVYKGIDCEGYVTIKNLLNHTSGINDYFEGKTINDKSIISEMLIKKDKLYTPMELIDYTRENQVPINLPNEQFYYSDTGYILLGLVIEKLYKKEYYQVLRDEIFDPLHMKDTGLHLYDETVQDKELAPAYISKIDVSKFKSLSIDFSGGGLSTNLEDLKRFMIGLIDESLIQKETLRKMTQFDHHFQAGIFYGLGLMELRFEKFFFLLRGFPRLIGHSGILGVHAWIDPNTLDVIIINIGDMSKNIRSYRLLIQLQTYLNKL